MASQLTKQISTPEGFFNAIPENVTENIEYRMNLHDALSKDKEMQRAYLELCWSDIRIMFNSAFWVYDTQDERGLRNKPFILWPHQKKVVKNIHESIIEQKDLAIDKSRKEGATEIICKTFAGHFILNPESNFLVGSRKAEYVDKGVEIVNGKLRGLHKTLMHKVCYALVNLPAWMRPAVVKTYMLLQNLENDSVISGEATNENFGAGDRQNAILIDEYGRMDHAMAVNIIDSVHDTSDCLIVNSTHFWGPQHPYNQLLTQRYGKIAISKLPWWENPTKNKGLYISPDYDVIQINDIEHYREICPEVFGRIKFMEPFKLSTIEKENLTTPWIDKLESIRLVADGGDKNEGGWRSPWYDKEEEERRPSDIARNLDMRPRGSGFSVFTPATLHRVEKEFIRPKQFTGDIKVIYKRRKVIAGKLTTGKRAKLLWYSDLVAGRPNQNHNYIVGCDIGLGRGASNSVASIVDVELREEVGKWICPNTPPESFGDVAVALCKWIGGKDKEPLLIWESNGPGLNFEHSVVKHNYPFIYIQRDEKARRKKKKNKRGWTNTKGPDGTKFHLLLDLDDALSEGLKETPKRNFIRVRDINIIREAECYIFNSSGTPMPAKMGEDDETEASSAHGDRIVSLGLCNLGLLYQPKALIEKRATTNKHTVGKRIQERLTTARKEKQDKRFIY